jgi:hypothetical protein
MEASQLESFRFIFKCSREIIKDFIFKCSTEIIKDLWTPSQMAAG